jgi:hypothetical protein
MLRILCEICKNILNIFNIYMLLFHYIFGLFIGTQIGKGNERNKNSYYHHTEKIVNLELKIKEYERLLSKKN